MRYDNFTVTMIYFSHCKLLQDISQNCTELYLYLPRLSSVAKHTGYTTKAIRRDTTKTQENVLFLIYIHRIMWRKYLLISFKCTYVQNPYRRLQIYNTYASHGYLEILNQDQWELLQQYLSTNIPRTEQQLLSYRLKR